jgi:hypothetical protein
MKKDSQRELLIADRYSLREIYEFFYVILISIELFKHI